MNSIFILTPVVIILAIVTRTVLVLFPRINVPPHLHNHKIVYDAGLIPSDIGAELRTMIKEMKDFPSNIAADLKTGGFKPLYEHIGEAVPLVNGQSSCAHPLLVPNVNKSMCVLPQRVDVGRHFILSGGVDGMKEDFDVMIDRVSSFGRYIFKVDEFPVVNELFQNSKFQNAAKSVCPANKQVLDPFQFNIIMQVPGQTVALHLDSPYFWGATRFEFPQWLLVAMVFSDLFTDKFVDQVQVVGYLHDWVPTQNAAGDFVYYVNNTSFGAVQPAPLSGISVDGSKVVHATKVYFPTVKAPHLDKDKDSVLSFRGGDDWILTMNNKIVGTYKTSELRVSIVYRARCFATAEDKDTFSRNIADGVHISLDDILTKFKNDLVRQKKITPAKRDTINSLDLAFLIMDTYIKYPLPEVDASIIPFNYCAAGKIVPQLAPVLSLICG